MVRLWASGVIAAAVVTASQVSALSVTNTTMTGINDGATIDATQSLAPNNFNQEFANSNDTGTYAGEEFFFGSLALSEIPIDNGSFGFWFDAIEPGNNRQVSITEIVLVVSGIKVFDFDEATFGPLMLNYGANSTHTSTPLSAGGDMLLNVPVASFQGQGFTGASILEFYWQQDDSGLRGTPEQWTTVKNGTTLSPTDPLDPTAVVPLPAGLPLLAGALCLAGWSTRRRN